MKSLLLYNDNLSEEIIEIFDQREVVRIPRASAQQEGFDADYFYDNILAGLLKEPLDAIFITYNLSNEDFLELNGLRLALHIRLTPRWNNQFTPIVFLSLGDVQAIQIRKLSILGDVLFTPGTLFTSTISSDGIKEAIERIGKGPMLSNLNFQEFLNNIQIPPLEHFESHHAITNEWAMHRILSMLEKESNKQTYASFAEKVESLRITRTLYFKYLDIQSKREKFGSKQKSKPKINKAENAKIALIDDEAVKGWGAFMEYLAEGSNARAYVFSEFSRHLEKEALIIRIMLWLDNLIQTDGLPDVFVVDLRLHESDVYQTEFKALTGMLIINEILKRNEGAQIVVFTASNKIWNMQAAIKIGAAAYVIKEGPQYYYDRENSKDLVLQLTRGIEAACQRSYLAELYDLIVKIKQIPVSQFTQRASQDFLRSLTSRDGWLDQIWGLLKLDQELTYKQAIILLFQVLENYTDLPEVGSIGRTNADRAKSLAGSAETFTGRVEVFAPVPSDPNKISSMFDLTYSTHPFQLTADLSPTSVTLFENKQLISVFTYSLDVTTIVKFITILVYRNHCTAAEINELIKLRFYRSNVCAHVTGAVDTEIFSAGPKEFIFMLKIIEKALNL